MTNFPFRLAEGVLQSNPLVAGSGTALTFGLAADLAGRAWDRIRHGENQGTADKLRLPVAIGTGALATIMSSLRYAQKQSSVKHAFFGSSAGDDKSHLRGVVRSSSAPFEAKSAMQSAISGLSPDQARRIRQAIGFAGASAAVGIIASQLLGMGLISSTIVALVAGVGGARFLGGPPRGPRAYGGMQPFQSLGFI